LVYFTAIWYFSPVLVHCVNENLATLEWRRNFGTQTKVWKMADSITVQFFCQNRDCGYCKNCDDLRHLWKRTTISSTSAAYKYLESGSSQNNGPQIKDIISIWAHLTITFFSLRAHYVEKWLCFLK
jgi:hypothetical protein